MRKNRITYLLAVLLFSATTFAQVVKQSELTGIWQKCISLNKGMNGVTEYTTASQFKIFSPNGDLNMLIANPGGGRSILTSVGTFKETSDSTYVENIARNSDSSLNGKSVEITYKLVDERFLYKRFYIEYTSNGLPQKGWMQEVWVKVEELSPTKPTEKQIRL